MGTRYQTLTEEHIEFIARQKIFFVGTATADSRVNISPKGQDSLRVLSPSRVAWLNVTGSGNETSAHVQLNSRMTLMFAAFEGAPIILRLYGKARVIHHTDPRWGSMLSMFSLLPGARQIFDMDIELVQKSCGMSVPFFDYLGEREQLNNWAEKKGQDGIAKYWAEKNQLSIDGLPTNIVDKNGLSD